MPPGASVPETSATASRTAEWRKRKLEADPEYFRKQEQARRDQKRALKAASEDATKPMTLTAAAAAAAAPSPQPELLLGADAGVDEQELEDLADALTNVRGVKIVGNSREIYINAWWGCGRPRQAGWPASLLDRAPPKTPPNFLVVTLIRRHPPSSDS